MNPVSTSDMPRPPLEPAQGLEAGVGSVSSYKESPIDQA